MYRSSLDSVAAVVFVENEGTGVLYHSCPLRLAIHKQTNMQRLVQTDTVSGGLMVNSGTLGSTFCLPGFLHLITFRKQAKILLSFLSISVYLLFSTLSSDLA